MNLRALGELLITLADLENVRGHLLDHENRIYEVERRMATQQEVLARIDAFTTGLGNDVLVIRDQITALRQAIVDGNQAAIESAMETLVPSIDRMQEIGTQLHAVASGPDPAIPDGGE